MVDKLQAAFTAGELSPAFDARVDQTKFHIGASLMRNVFVHAEGGFSNRPGTKFIQEAPGKPRLYRFRFSAIQTYVLEFTDKLMRVYKDGGIVESAPSVPFTLVTPWAEADLFGLRFAQSADVLFVVHPGYPPQEITRTGDAAWTIGAVSFATTATTPASKPTLAYSKTVIGAPNGDINPPDHKWVLSGFGSNVYYLEGRSDPVRVEQDGTPLNDVGDASNIALSGDWGHGDQDTLGYNTIYARGTADEDLNSEDMSAVYASTAGIGARSYTYVYTAINAAGEESLASPSESVLVDNPWPTDGTVTVTLTAVTGAVRYNVYKNSRGKFGFIGSTSGLTFVDDNIDPDTLLAPPSSNNPFAASGDYPAAIAIFEQRLFLARTDNNPQTIWASQTGALRNYNTSEPLLDTDSIQVTIASTEVNEIEHLLPLGDLLIFTKAGEWRAFTGSNSDALTPFSIQLRKESYRGTGEVPPLPIGNSALFIQRNGRAVRDLFFSIENGGFLGNNLSVLASHLLRDGVIADWAYQQTPGSLVWSVLDNGDGRILSYLREHDVWAWSRFDTDGEFVSATAIESAEEDEVYVAVKRTIGAQDKYYVEIIQPHKPTPGETASLDDAWFVDSGLDYDGAPVNTFSGLDHLEGKTVVALADGSVYSATSMVVSGGEVSLPNGVTAAKVKIGLPYSWDFESVAYDFSSNQGTTQGQSQNIPEVIIRVLNTRDILVGPNDQKLYPVKQRQYENYDTATDLGNGDLRVQVHNTWDRRARIHIRGENPVPATILGVIPEMVVNP